MRYTGSGRNTRDENVDARLFFGLDLPRSGLRAAKDSLRAVSRNKDSSQRCLLGTVVRRGLGNFLSVFFS
jgi:hypothetical protein